MSTDTLMKIAREILPAVIDDTESLVEAEKFLTSFLRDGTIDSAEMPDQVRTMIASLGAILTPETQALLDGILARDDGRIAREARSLMASGPAAILLAAYKAQAAAAKLE